MIGMVRGMLVTLRHAFKAPVTKRYPDLAPPLAPRFRGFLRLRGLIDRRPLVPYSEKMAPCTAGCPANVDARGYINCITRGAEDEGYWLHMENNPLPATFGRMCYAPCEQTCTRDEWDRGLAIRSLKRHMADTALAMMDAGKIPRPSRDGAPERPERIAVIGAGPAGLSCAYYLAKLGYQITIFDRAEQPGGMLMYGIPTYRLPREILLKEIDLILGLGGIDLNLNQAIGRDFSLADLFAQGFSAVFLGVGAHMSQKLGIPGENLEGVMSGEALLGGIARDVIGDLGENVVVIGAGNTAMDAARSAKRLGAEVLVMYRRSEAEMPAHHFEYEEALAEGVDFQFLAAPVRLIGENGRVSTIESSRIELGEPDERGRRRPVHIPGSEFVTPASTVLTAIGRVGSYHEDDEGGGWLAGTGIELTRRGTIQADWSSCRTTRSGVFAGGDAIRGATTAIEAIGDGHRAALGIHNFLQKGKIGPVDISPKTWVDMKTRFHFIPRIPPEELTAGERIHDFREVEQTYPKATALAEGERCLCCESRSCIGCGICASVCPDQCIFMTIRQNGARHIEEFNIAFYLCSYCGMCEDACPTKTLVHTRNFARSVYDMQDLMFGKEQLLQLEE